MRRILYLDDLRPCPWDNSIEKYYCVRSYSEFVEWIDENGMPDEFDLDHDLGDGGTGYDCIKYVIEKDTLDPVDRLPKLKVHSANPVGKENIERLWKNYIRFRDNKN